jgi:hypothetical protein
MSNEKVDIVGIEWYDGNEGYIDPAAPTLAICFDNGKVQLMKNETDDSNASHKIHCNLIFFT